jgi:predicted O-methyltransferase YrrM
MLSESEVNLQNALPIQGWMREEALVYLASMASRSWRIAEIGAWKGRSTVGMAENTAGTVYAIDTWKGSDEWAHQSEIEQHPEGWLYEEFCTNTKHLRNVVPCKMPSLQAAEHFRQLGFTFDFIFIDASHDYGNVKADILAWKPLLAPGGVFSGHDYAEWAPGVVQAVKELIPSYRVVGVTIWTTEGV